MNLFKPLERIHNEFFSRRFLRNFAMFPIAGVVIYWVILNTGPRTASVIVDVFASDVVVSMGGQSFHIDEFTGVPIVCELPVGRHRLVMKQGETVLHEASFTLKGGEERILCAWRSIESAAMNPPASPDNLAQVKLSEDE